MASKYKLLAFERYDPTDESLRWLESQGVEVIMGNPLWEMPLKKYSEDQLIDLAKDCDALMGASGTRITNRIMLELPKLRVISKFGIGVDSIDVEAATRNGIIVTSTPNDYQIFPVSEHAVAMMLALAKQFTTWTNSFMQEGGWRGLTHSATLRGATVGIIGLGRIGYGVAQRLQGWGARIVAFDPYLTTKPEGVELVTLEELLSDSDFITLHAPPDASRKHIIDAERFKLIKSTAYLINTGRGSLIDYKVLRERITEGTLAGVALDVFDQEPPNPADPLFKASNVINTPHVAAWTNKGTQEIGWHASRNLWAILSGEGKADIANPEVLDCLRKVA